ncbi:MAG: hypothetical protein PHI63_06720 [Patescibacteria group bacterium]|nr:hypothetical protein [Patescibacteria group bacterium]
MTKPNARKLAAKQEALEGERFYAAAVRLRRRLLIARRVSSWSIKFFSKLEKLKILRNDWRQQRMLSAAVRMSLKYPDLLVVVGDPKTNVLTVAHNKLHCAFRVMDFEDQEIKLVEGLLDEDARPKHLLRLMRLLDGAIYNLKHGTPDAPAERGLPTEKPLQVSSSLR